MPAKIPTKASLLDDEDDANPYAVTDEKQGFRCPNCANEMESVDAIICLFCGYNTVTRMSPGTRKIHETTGWDQTKWLLPAFAAILGIIALIGGLIYYHFELPYVIFDTHPSWADVEKDPETEGSRVKIVKKIDLFSANMFLPMIELWPAIFVLFMGYKLGRFAFVRLVLDPKPPEKVKVG